MFKTIIIYLTFCFLINESTSRSINNSTTVQRIVGGRRTSIRRHPWHAAVFELHKFDFEYICGGVILNPKYVLTAAHCLNPSSSFYARFGASLRNQRLRLFRADPVIHPKYDENRYDIGVLVLHEDIRLDGIRTKAINLPSRNEEIPDNQRVVVTGWGLLSEDGPRANRLREVTIPIVNFERCKRWLAQYKNVTDDMICAGLSEGGRDSCMGDSGGPLVIRRNQTLVGIVSWGVGCARPKLPGVYTNVAYVRDWIKEVTGL